MSDGGVVVIDYLIAKEKNDGWVCVKNNTNKKNRDETVLWLFEQSETLDVAKRTTHRAIRLHDLYCMTIDGGGSCPTLGCVCLWIAMKFEEMYAFVDILDIKEDDMTIETLTALEAIVLKALEWKVYQLTLADWIETVDPTGGGSTVTTSGNASCGVTAICQCIVDLLSFDCSDQLYATPPSVIFRDVLVVARDVHAERPVADRESIVVMCVLSQMHRLSICANHTHVQRLLTKAFCGAVPKRLRK